MDTAIAGRPEDRQRSYTNVSPIQRALAVLEAANRLPEITVSALSQECGIPRPTVVRILETLCHEGFLEQLEPRGQYTLTSKVRALSAGFDDTQFAVEVLRPHADRLTRKHLWPVSVATLQGNAMVVRYSTISRSPLAHTRTTLFKKLSLTRRAHGIAYLAFCSSAERHQLLAVTEALSGAEPSTLGQSSELQRMLIHCRRRGFALRRAQVDVNTGTIAVPVLGHRGAVLATLGMTFFHRVVSDSQTEALAKFLQAAAAIAATRLTRCDAPQPDP